MANKQTEYNRGRQQGLEIALKVLRDGGDKQGVKLVQDEIDRRGKVGISTAATVKELEKAAMPIKLCMYESFLCQSLMVLRDEYGFGQARCKRFMDRWKLKEKCLEDGLVTWRDYVDAIKDELDIQLPTDGMALNELI